MPVKKHTMKLIILFICAAGLGWGAFWLLHAGQNAARVALPHETVPQAPFAAASAVPVSESLPRQKILDNDYHIFQTFNNCAPAALSMALSYYGVERSQEELAEALRPYNNRTGNNDDKSTPPDELAEKGKEYGLLPYYRASGNIALLKRLVAAGMPVLVRTLLEPGKDYAHYRVIKGYDDDRGQIIQDDSLQGKNLRYSYDTFLDLWQPFNYAYLVFAPPEKQKAVETILGEEFDAHVAWRNALEAAEWEIESDPGNISAHFNKAVALYYLNEYARASEAFEAIESRLPMRVLWYQIEPIQAYFAAGNYMRVFSLSDAIFSQNNRAFSELYLLRGKSRLKQGNAMLAKEEFEKAVLYNKNSKAAREAFESLTSAVF